MDPWLGLILVIISGISLLGIAWILYIQVYGIFPKKAEDTKVIPIKVREMPRCQFCDNILGKIQRARSGQLCCDKCAVTVFGETSSSSPV